MYYRLKKVYKFGIFSTIKKIFFPIKKEAKTKRERNNVEKIIHTVLYHLKKEGKKDITVHFGTFSDSSIVKKIIFLEKQSPTYKSKLLLVEDPYPYYHWLR